MTETQAASRHATKDSESDAPSKAELDERKKVDAENKERDEKAVKEAEEQAKQDEADVEAFLAVQRGEKLLRGDDGSFDHPAFLARREAERRAEEDDED